MKKGLGEQALRGELVQCQRYLPPGGVRIPGVWQIAYEGFDDGIDVVLSVAVGPDERGPQAQRFGLAAACVVETELAIHGSQGEIPPATGIGNSSGALVHTRELRRNQA